MRILATISSTLKLKLPLPTSEYKLQKKRKGYAVTVSIMTDNETLYIKTPTSRNEKQILKKRLKFINIFFITSPSVLFSYRYNKG